MLDALPTKNQRTNVRILKGIYNIMHNRIIIVIVIIVIVIVIVIIIIIIIIKKAKI